MPLMNLKGPEGRLTLQLKLPSEDRESRQRLMHQEWQLSRLCRDRGWKLRLGPNMPWPIRQSEDRGLTQRSNVRESRERQYFVDQELRLLSDQTLSQISSKSQGWSQNYSRQDCTSKGLSVRYYVDQESRLRPKS
jgi:hypothetical protein